MTLTEIEGFTTDMQFSAVKDFVYSLVRIGKLKGCGLDPNEPWRFVEIFTAEDGSEWHMAIPDHAFRGYLRKIR